MLPKLDSVEWSAQWGVAQKLDALNEAIQSIQECLDGKLGKIIEKEIVDVRNTLVSKEDGDKTNGRSVKKKSKR